MRTHLPYSALTLFLSLAPLLGCANGESLPDGGSSGGTDSEGGRRFAVNATPTVFADGACSEFFCWEQPQPFGGRVNALVTAETTVWAAADGALARRVDGQWSAASTRNLKDVWALTDHQVWAVGGGGAIVHWDGLRLTEMVSPTRETLNGIWGAAADDIWAVGDGGVILRYNGATWTQVEQAYDNMHDVWGSGPNDVYAVGGKLNVSTVAHFNGTSLSLMQSGLSGAAMFTVDGAGPDAVFAAGEYGRISRLTPAGATTVTHTGNQPVSDIKVNSETDVWAVTHDALYFYDGSSTGTVTETGAQTILADPTEPQWLLGGSGVLALGAEGQAIEISPPLFEKLWLGPNGKGVAITGQGEVLQNASGDWQSVDQLADDYSWRFTIGGTNDGSSYVFHQGDEALAAYALNGAGATAIPTPDWLPEVVVGTSSTDVWAFSYTSYGHFNGSQWQSGELPAMIVHGAAALAPDAVWAVGEFEDGGGAAAFYNGSTWSVQSVGGNKHILSSVASFQGKTYAAGVLRDWDQSQTCNGWNCALHEPALFAFADGAWTQLLLPGVGTSWEYNQDAHVAAGETELFFAVSEPAPGLDNLLVFDGTTWSSRPFPAAIADGMFPATDGTLRLAAGSFPFGILRSR